MIAQASASWTGSWHEGEGHLSAASDTVRDLPFSYASRFDGAPGGNPEELFALAYAGCLTQAVSNTLGWGNYRIDRIDTSVRVETRMGERAPEFCGIHITIRAKVPGIKPNQFLGLVNVAKTGCMISQLLKVEPTLDRRSTPIEQPDGQRASPSYMVERPFLPENVHRCAIPKIRRKTRASNWLRPPRVRSAGTGSLAPVSSD